MTTCIFHCMEVPHWLNWSAVDKHLGCVSVFWWTCYLKIVLLNVTKLLFIQAECWWAVFWSSFSLFFFLMSSLNCIFWKTIVKQIYLWNLPTYVLYPNERAVFFRTYRFVCFTSILFLMCYNCDEIYASSPHTLPSLKVKVAQSCPTLCDPVDYIVHGFLQAGILEWVAFPFSRGSSQPRDQIQVCHTVGGFFTSWATRETPTPNPRQTANLCSLLWRSIFPSECPVLALQVLGTLSLL